MSVRKTRRDAALDRIADHMLSHGLAPSSLRALAAAAGTSDRMLLYYFADKDEIVVSAMRTVSARLSALLAGAVGQASALPPDALLRQLAPLLRGPELRPYMRLWLELSALAARDLQPFKAVAGQIADAFVLMISQRLDLPDEAARKTEACALIALLDGMVLLDCVGRHASSDAILARGSMG